MSEYYMGVLVGAGIGYCLALITLVMMWTLCVVAKEQDDEREADEENRN